MKPPDVEPEFVTTETAAKLLSISAPSVRRLAAKGDLKKVYVGKAVRFRASDIRNFGREPLLECR